MVPSEATPYDDALILCEGGDKVLDLLRAMAQQAEQAQAAFLDDVRPLLEQADKDIEKYGMRDLVRPALKQMQQAWVGVLEREVRFFDLIVEIERIHEELFAIVTSEDKSP